MSAPAMRQLRRQLEEFIQQGIDLLDEMDAAGIEREPDTDAEVISEDDGIVRQWWAMGQAYGERSA